MFPHRLPSSVQTSTCTYIVVTKRFDLPITMIDSTINIHKILQATLTKS